MEETIHMQDGTEAVLKGRFNLPSKDNILFYIVKENKPYSPQDKDVVCLTPTSTHKSRLSAESFDTYKAGGINKLIFHQDLWNVVSGNDVDEVEIYSDKTKEFYSNIETLRLAETKHAQRAEKIEETEAKADNTKEEVQEIISKKRSKKTQKDKEMSDTQTTKKKNATLAMLKDAGLDAVKQVTAGEVNEQMALLITKGLKTAGVPDKYVDSELAKVLIRVLGPGGIHWIAETQSDSIDEMLGAGFSEKLKSASKFATQSVAVDYVKPAMAFVIPMLKELASTDGLASLMTEVEEEKTSKKVKVKATV